MTDTPGDRSGAEAPRNNDVEAPRGEVSRAELEAENARLRARVAELEAAAGLGAAGSGERDEGAPRNATYEQLILLLDAAPIRIFIKDREQRLIFVNKEFAGFRGQRSADFIGLTERDFFAPEIAEKLLTLEAEITASGEPYNREEELVSLDGTRWIHTNKFPLYDTGGACVGIGALITDITDRKLLNEERLVLQEKVIAAQQAALRELSTPLLPLTDGVLAMPIVGSVDSLRASEILETLLQGISERRVHTAILDITGVRGIDAQTADALVGAARAARLLGARVILTGVSPAVARTLVELDADLDGIAILATLASGIAHALRR